MLRFALTLACCALVIPVAGCGGQIGPKQVRIQAASVASTATEGGTVGSQRASGRVGSTFARAQLEQLAGAASSPADALGKGAVLTRVSAMAADTQALALESQRRLNALAEHVDDPLVRETNTKRLLEIADEASSLSERAEDIELSDGGDS